MAHVFGLVLRSLGVRRRSVPVTAARPADAPVDEAHPRRSAADPVLVSLARRCAVLAAQQRELIDRLTSGLRDPAEVAALRHLDHLAVLVRRAGADLRVLAGEDRGARAPGPVPLHAVLHDAAAGGARSRRVIVRRPPEVAVAPHVAPDLVHLLTVLLDDATSRCAPGAAVLMGAASAAESGTAVEIVAPGHGMTPGELADANAVLSGSDEAPAVADLVVAGRLVARHPLTARLRALREEPGMVAVVDLPAECLVAAAPAVQEPAPGVQGPAPAVPEPAPAVRDPAPAVPEPAPAVRDPAPAVQEPAPAVRDPAPAAASAPAQVADVPQPESQTGAAAPQATEQQWVELFGRPVRDRPGRHAAAAAEPAPRWFAGTDDAAAPAWASVDDAGWRAADALDGAPDPGVTAAGLPRRQRGARLLPGSAGAAPAEGPARDAGSVRGRLDSYQRGLSQGRHALREPSEKD